MSPKSLVCGWDKENQNNINNINHIPDASKPLKPVSNQSTIEEEEESEERKALRKRVEEAVALHRAQRSVPGTPAPVEEFQEETEETHVVLNQSTLTSRSTGMTLDTEVQVPNTDRPIRPSRHFSTVLAVLLVFAIAVWSGVRVVLLDPKTAMVMKYQPYVEQGITLFTSKLDFLTMEAVPHPDKGGELAFIEIESSTSIVEEAEPTPVELTVETDCVEDVMVDVVEHMEVLVEVVRSEEDAAPAIEAAALEETALEEAEKAIVKPSVASEVVLLIAPPASRTQVVLRKAFDVLSPLKKMLAKIQDKFAHVMHGISRFFRGKAK